MANREHVDIGIIGCGDITREFKLFNNPHICDVVKD